MIYWHVSQAFLIILHWYLPGLVILNVVVVHKILIAILTNKCLVKICYSSELNASQYLMALKQEQYMQYSRIQSVSWLHLDNVFNWCMLKFGQPWSLTKKEKKPPSFIHNRKLIIISILKTGKQWFYCLKHQWNIVWRGVTLINVIVIYRHGYLIQYLDHTMEL